MYSSFSPPPFLPSIPKPSIFHLTHHSNVTSPTSLLLPKPSPSRSTLHNFTPRPSASAFLTSGGYTLREVIQPSTRDRLKLLVSEFSSINEPVGRVKRLLEYAARLPPFDDSARSPAHKVTGCTTQVWLQLSVDNEGKMRFSADSDSEITKGFIWCLVYVLDGAEAEEVIAVKAEELAAVNVGLYGKEQSRVNTWHNILTAMQNRTKDFMATPNFKVYS